MRQGLAPIGIESIDLHHLKQKDNGIIIELTSREHKGNYKNSIDAKEKEKVKLIDRSLQYGKKSIGKKSKGA